MIGAAVAAGASGEQVDHLLADLAFASGDDVTALAGYEVLLAKRPGDPRVAERAGIAALKQSDLTKATAMLDRATALAGASWRAWNARGVVADLASDWDRAEKCYDRADALAPGRGEIANNRGWSRLLRGEWQGALVALERAATLDPGSVRIANNLDLARSALADQLPQRRSGESDGQWAARLNDAGVAAAARGERGRATAAFARAIVLRSEWFGRAATNLASVAAKR